MNFIPFPTLTTEHLVLRQLKIEDQNKIFKLRSDKNVNKYLDRPKANSLQDALAFIEKINTSIQNNEALYWAISLKDHDQLTGTICLWNFSKEDLTAEIGYELLPEYQGRGIMQEAFEKVIAFGFEKLNLREIVAELDQENSRSVKILERNGFILSKKMKNSVVVYSLNKKTY